MATKPRASGGFEVKRNQSLLLLAGAFAVSSSLRGSGGGRRCNRTRKLQRQQQLGEWDREPHRWRSVTRRRVSTGQVTLKGGSSVVLRHQLRGELFTSSKVVLVQGMARFDNMKPGFKRCLLLRCTSRTIRRVAKELFA